MTMNLIFLDHEIIIDGHEIPNSCVKIQRLLLTDQQFGHKKMLDSPQRKQKSPSSGRILLEKPNPSQKKHFLLIPASFSLNTYKKNAQLPPNCLPMPCI